MPRGVYQKRLKPLHDRLYAKLQTTPGTGCWVWVGSKNKFGYGNIAVGGYGKAGKRLIRAHRAMWEITKGPIPHGLCVLHDCDNPSCCNPDHLFLGTKLTNMRDMIDKGRARHPRKLTNEQVSDIRNTRGLTHLEISKRFNISQGYVSIIRAGLVR